MSFVAKVVCGKLV
ncbi:hypothetical protein M2H39_22320 [Vibrio vulnificus]|nr:hypothetical protein [Vibrio vulnificus]